MEILRQLPPYAVQLGAAMVVFHLAALIGGETADTFLALVPAYTIGVAHICPWNIFTAAFYEPRSLVLLGDLAALAAFGRFMGSRWTSAQFAYFLAFVNVISALVVIAILIFMYASQLSVDLLFSPHSGFFGVIGAFTVVYKQLSTDELLFGKLPISPGLAPLLYVLVWLGIAAAFRIGPEVSFPLLGVYLGWFYLRFLQKQEDGTRGDRRDEFAFVSFFPAVLRPVVEPLSKGTYLLCGCCTRFEDTRGAAAPKPVVPAGTAPALPGSAPADSERRRQLALKALDERMSSPSTAPPSGTSLTAASPEKKGADAV